MIKNYVEKVIAREDLTFNEAYELMSHIMNGEVTDSLKAAFLTSLNCKGFSPNEIGGFAASLRENCTRLELDVENVVDLCGTGGDGSGTFNISTAAAFVVAGAGVKVAKHGNRSITSKSGSSDVLTELGVDILMNPLKTKRAIEEIGIGFLFAPFYHPATKNVAKVRKELGFKTVFNVLGPLTNPTNTKHQVVGTFNDSVAVIMAEASRLLGYEKVCFLCTDDRYDEITLAGDTNVYEYNSGRNIVSYQVDNETFELPQADMESLKGGTPKQNAEIIFNILTGSRTDAAADVVIANAAMALYCGGVDDNLAACGKKAEESIRSGRAYNKLKALANFEG